MSVELAAATSIAERVLAALAMAGTQADTVEIDGDQVTVRLRPPARGDHDGSAYLLVTDVQDALEDIDGIGPVRVLIDGHPVSAEPRDVFLRNAHLAAVDRALAVLIAPPVGADETRRLLLRDIPHGPQKSALLRRRFAIGLSNCPNSPVTQQIS